MRTTREVIEGQLLAMGVALFEVGACTDCPYPGDPEGLLRTWDAATLMRSLGWLRFQNLHGRHIYIRPKGEHPLTLLDDLKPSTLERLRAEGFQPTLVVESSPGNFQAWLNHGEVLPAALSTAAAKALAEKFGADPGAAAWRQFGRLAGFTNCKEKYRGPDGLFPYVKLTCGTGEVYPQAGPFLAELRRAFERQRQARPAPRPRRGLPTRRHPLRPIDDFRRQPAYQGDGHRIDLAYALYALSHGMPEDEVRSAIASRDLSHKGGQRRQADYVDRTVEKAWKEILGWGRAR